MRELRANGLLNHVSTLTNMIKAELEQERKCANNARCKPPNWKSIVSYIEYAFEIKCSVEEVIKAVHFYKFH